MNLRITFNVILISFFLNPCRGQGDLRIVDTDWIINNMKLKLIVDSLYLEIEDSLNQIGVKWVQYFQSNQLKKLRDVGCSGPETLKKVEDELRREHLKIRKFEEFVMDTLPEFKNKLKDELSDLIKQEVKNYAKEKDIGIVVEKKSLIYYGVQKKEVSQEILKRVEEKSHELEFIWDKKLKNIWKNNSISEILKE